MEGVFVFQYVHNNQALAFSCGKRKVFSSHPFLHNRGEKAVPILSNMDPRPALLAAVPFNSSKHIEDYLPSLDVLGLLRSEPISETILGRAFIAAFPSTVFSASKIINRLLSTEEREHARLSDDESARHEWSNEVFLPAVPPLYKVQRDYRCMGLEGTHPFYRFASELPEELLWIRFFAEGYAPSWIAWSRYDSDGALVHDSHARVPDRRGQTHGHASVPSHILQWGKRLFGVQCTRQLCYSQKSGAPSAVLSCVCFIWSSITKTKDDEIVMRTAVKGFAKRSRHPRKILDPPEVTTTIDAEQKAVLDRAWKGFDAHCSRFPNLEPWRTQFLKIWGIDKRGRTDAETAKLIASAFDAEYASQKTEERFRLLVQRLGWLESMVMLIENISSEAWHLRIICEEFLHPLLASGTMPAGFATTPALLDALFVSYPKKVRNRLWALFEQIRHRDPYSK